MLTACSRARLSKQLQTRTSRSEPRRSRSGQSDFLTPVEPLGLYARLRADNLAHVMPTCYRLLPVLPACWALAALAQPGAPPVSELIRVDSHVAVTMRDGVKLYADVYRPQREGKFPVLVTRTPYGVQRDGMHRDVIRFAQRGYAVVVEDTRRAI